MMKILRVVESSQLGLKPIDFFLVFVDDCLDPQSEDVLADQSSLGDGVTRPMDSLSVIETEHDHPLPYLPAM
jgi:hypothetical protein